MAPVEAETGKAKPYPAEKDHSGSTGQCCSQHRPVRNMAFRSSFPTGINASVVPERIQQADTARRPVSSQTSSAEFDIPDTAKRIKMVAGIGTRSVTVSGRIKAPEERATTRGQINRFIGRPERDPDPWYFRRKIRLRSRAMYSPGQADASRRRKSLRPMKTVPSGTRLSFTRGPQRDPGVKECRAGGRLHVARPV